MSLSECIVVNDNELIKTNDSPGVCDTLRSKCHYFVSLEKKVLVWEKNIEFRFLKVAVVSARLNT